MRRKRPKFPRRKLAEAIELLKRLEARATIYDGNHEDCDCAHCDTRRFLTSVEPRFKTPE